MSRKNHGKQEMIQRMKKKKLTKKSIGYQPFCLKMLTRCTKNFKLDSQIDEHATSRTF